MRRTAHLPILTFPHTPSPAALDSALQAVQALQADLSATLFSADLPPASASIAGVVIGISDMIRKVENDSRDQAEALAATIRRMAGDKGLRADVETRAASTAAATAGLVTAARYHDLNILPWDADNLTGREIAEAVIFGAGRPCLIVPAGSRPIAFRHVAIAWDGSRVAARAVADALPLFGDTPRMTIITVDDNKHLDAGIGTRLASHLGAKGIAVDHHPIASRGRPISQVLQDASGRLEADMLVMGGYGHSRMRDFIVGGATLGILACPTLPVLISH